MSTQLKSSEPVRLPSTPLGRNWLRQFKTARDQALAAQLLKQLKLVSGREFESAISESLVSLQNRLGKTIAVYPVSKPYPPGIVGYNAFTGGIPDVNATGSTPGAGKRRKFGSEDRVGHLLLRIQERCKTGSGSKIECVPTLHQLRTQGITRIHSPICFVSTVVFTTCVP
jgi:hypothetical protein